MRARSVFNAIASLLTVALALPAAAQQPEHYVLDGFGGVHAGGGAPVVSPAPPYFGFDVAVDVTYVPSELFYIDRSGVLVLDAFGGVHRGGGLANAVPGKATTPYFGFDIARAVVYRDQRPLVFTVSVDAGGGTFTSEGVTGVTKTGTGIYNVAFDRPVGFCTFVASLSVPSSLGLPSFTGIPGYASTSLDVTAEGVWVATMDDTAALADQSFSLVVVCPQRW